MKKYLLSIQRGFLSFSLLIVVWYLICRFSGVNPILFPSPTKVFHAWLELFTIGLRGSTSDATLWMHAMVSLRRFCIAYSLASMLAMIFGMIVGRFPILFAYANPVIQIIRPIAPVAWLPFIVLLVGIGDIPAISIIFIAGFFPILLATVSAVRHIEPVYLKVAKNFDLTQSETLYKIIFPAVFPQIALSLKQALATSWIFLVSGEMVGAQSGLDFLIMDSKNCIRPDALLATMLTIGILGWLLDYTMEVLEGFINKRWGFGIRKYNTEEE